MGRTLTNNTAVAYAIETTVGVLPGSPSWKTITPNGISNLGAKIDKVARNPISKNRQRLKGSIVNLASGFGSEVDLIMEHVIDFAEGFMFSTFKGGRVVYPTAVTTSAYTVPAMSNALTSGTLVYGRGFLNSANNGLKVVTTGGTTTSIPITGGGMTAETTTNPTQNATVEVAGVQGATGDIQINASGNLQSTALDWTTLGLTVGQWILVGGTVAGTTFASLSTATPAQRYARITSISATILGIDKKAISFTTDTGTGKTIHVYFGRFVRNVAVDNADYLERSFQFEVAFENLGVTPGSDMFMYPAGNFCNEMTFDFALGALAKLNVGFVGTDTPAPTSSRATNAATPVRQVQTTAFNPTSDFARLRLAESDDTGVTTDFKSLKFMLKNNVTPENKLGLLGAAYMNTGNFEISLDATMIFTNSRVVAAVRDNSTMSFDTAIRNGDGGLVIDVPEMTLSGGDPNFPENESVNIQMTAPAHQSGVFGYTGSFSIFPFVPAT